MRKVIFAIILILLLICISAKYSHSMTITTYQPTVEQCGNTRGITASGHKLRYGLCAADWRCYPPGTILKLSYIYKIPVSRGSFNRTHKRTFVSKKYTEYMVVADTGSAIKGKNKLDIGLGKIHYPKSVSVKVVKYGDKKLSPYKVVKKSIETRKVIIQNEQQSFIQDILKVRTISFNRYDGRILPESRNTQFNSEDYWLSSDGSTDFGGRFSKLCGISSI